MLMKTMICPRKLKLAGIVLFLVLLAVPLGCVFYLRDGWSSRPTTASDRCIGWPILVVKLAMIGSGEWEDGDIFHSFSFGRGKYTRTTKGVKFYTFSPIPGDHCTSSVFAVMDGKVVAIRGGC